MHVVMLSTSSGVLLLKDNSEIGKVIDCIMVLTFEAHKSK